MKKLNTFPKTVIVDGSNVGMGRHAPMRFEQNPLPSNEKVRPDARIIAGICLWGAEQNAMRPDEDATKMEVVFDANVWPVFKDSSRGSDEESIRLLDRLIADSGKDWVVTSSDAGVRADDLILAKADNRIMCGECPWIISNDKFLPSKHKDKDEREYVELYPWLCDVRQRSAVLHKFDVVGDELEIFGTGAVVKIPSGVAEYEERRTAIEELKITSKETEERRNDLVAANDAEVAPQPVSVYKDGWEDEGHDDWTGSLLGACVLGGAMLIGCYAGYQLGKGV